MNHNHKPTATPPSTVIAAAYNHFLPPSENDDDNDADPADLTGKYNCGVKKKEKGGHCRRYKDDNKIESLHSLYKEPKDDVDVEKCRENDDGCD